MRAQLERLQFLQELFPVAGESSGLIDRILPAAEILDGMVREAEAALRQGTGFIR